MRLTAPAVKQWLESDAAQCTAAELDALVEPLHQAIERTSQRERSGQEALAKATEAAKAAGFDSIEDLLRHTNPGAAAAISRAAPSMAGGAQRQLATPRKPYLDPRDPTTQAYALAKHHHEPDWVKQRLAEGWSKYELHYKRHAVGLARLGLTPLYDAEERYKQLMAAEQPRFRRK